MDYRESSRDQRVSSRGGGCLALGGVFGVDR